MFSECHGTDERSKFSKLACQDTFVISGSFSPQCARSRLPSLIVQHAKLKCRSDNPRNHSKWGAVNYCFFAIGAMNSAVNWLVGMPARRTILSARFNFYQINKIRGWTALSMPTLSMHNYCRTKCCVQLLETEPLPPSSSSDIIPTNPCWPKQSTYSRTLTMGNTVRQFYDRRLLQASE
jgi:hypothetical protein